MDTWTILSVALTVTYIFEFLRSIRELLMQYHLAGNGSESLLPPKGKCIYWLVLDKEASQTNREGDKRDTESRPTKHTGGNKKPKDLRLHLPDSCVIEERGLQSQHGLKHTHFYRGGIKKLKKHYFGPNDCFVWGLTFSFFLFL